VLTEVTANYGTPKSVAVSALITTGYDKMAKVEVRGFLKEPLSHTVTVPTHPASGIFLLDLTS